MKCPRHPEAWGPRLSHVSQRRGDEWGSGMLARPIIPVGGEIQHICLHSYHSVHHLLNDLHTYVYTLSLDPLEHGAPLMECAGKKGT